MDALTYAVPTALVALALGLLFYASRRWKPARPRASSARPPVTAEAPEPALAEAEAAPREGQAA